MATVACLLLAVLACRRSLHEPMQAGAAPVSGGEPPALDGGWLQPGEPLLLPLEGGQVRAHRLELAAGQSVAVQVEQRGIDVSVEVFAPDGLWLDTFDSPTGAHGPEPVILVADAPGTYRLDVRSVYSELAAGRYRIEIVERRPATTLDRHRDQAMRAHAVAARAAARRTATGLRRSLEQEEVALLHWRAVGSELGQCMAETGIAVSYRGLGELEEALDSYRRALEHCPDPQEPVETADPAADLLGWIPSMRSSVYAAIGGIYGSLGDSALAIEYYRTALALGERDGSQRRQADALTVMGVAFMDLGEPAQALGLFERALAIAQAEDHVQRQASLWTRVGDAHRALEKPRAALQAYSEALPLWRASQGHAARGLVGCLLRAGRAHLVLGESQRALESLHEARQLARTHGAGADVEVGLAELYAAAGSPVKAAAHYRAALRIARRGVSSRREQPALLGLARLAREQGQPEAALRWSHEALRGTEETWSRIANPRLKGPFLASQQEVYELHVDLLMELHRQRPADRFDVAALETAEGARARNLLQALRWDGAEPPKETDPALVQEEQRLRQRLQAWGARESQRFQDDVSLSGEDRDAETVERADLVSRYSEVVAAMRRQSPGYAALRHPLPASLQEIQRSVLDERTWLLTFALGEARSFLWVVTATSLESFELPPRGEIEPLAREVYELVSARSVDLEFEAKDGKRWRVEKADTDLPWASARLSEMLLGPVARRLAGERLMIVADGVLHHVPFSALPLPAAAGVEPSEVVPLLERHEVAAIPSASVLAFLRRQDRSQTPKAALTVLADPVFGPEDPRVLGLPVDRSQTAPMGGVPERPPAPSPAEPGAPLPRWRSRGTSLDRLPRLSGSLREAAAISALDPGSRSFLGFDARREVVTGGALADSRIVHFATHAIVSSEQPERSGIVLSLVDEKGDPINGFLSLNDIYRLELAADLIVLSGCKTALGQEMRGEGLIGLTRAFLHAGASAVVASLWSVEDEATAELMKRFYHGMLRELRAPASALREAQRSMGQEEIWSAPYYWAGFVLQGDWRGADPRDRDAAAYRLDAADKRSF